MIKHNGKLYTVGQRFKVKYIDKDSEIKYIQFQDKEFGAKLPKPIHRFQHSESGRLFGCREEDVQRAFRFGDWIPIEDKQPA